MKIARKMSISFLWLFTRKTLLHTHAQRRFSDASECVRAARNGATLCERFHFKVNFSIELSFRKIYGKCIWVSMKQFVLCSSGEVTFNSMLNSSLVDLRVNQHDWNRFQDASMSFASASAHAHSQQHSDRTCERQDEHSHVLFIPK